MNELGSRSATRRSILRGGAALAGAGALSIPLGRFALAQNATPMTGGADLSSLGLQELTVTVTDSGYEGLPSSVPAGRYLVTCMNQSTNDATASFMMLPEGMSASSFTGTPPEGTPEGGAPAEASPTGGDQGGPPSWYYTTSLAGGPGAAAGETVQSVIDLTPGNWVVWGDDPSAPQKPAPLSVTGGGSASPIAGATPSAAVTVNEVKTADGFAFQIDGTWQPGAQVIKIVNASDEPHFMLLLSSSAPLTMDQVMQLLQLPDNATPDPSSGLPNPADFKTAVYAATQSSGTTQWIEADLTAGTYVMLCFIPDPNKGDIPHAAEGMADIITVGGAGTPQATPAS